MAITGSSGSRETDLVEDPGKRMFFRKLDFTEKVQSKAPVRNRPVPATQGRWLNVAEKVSIAGDVFWCAWQPPIGQQSKTELVVAGDEGAILHKIGNEWKRYQTAEKLPIHSLFGTSESDLYAVGWMGQVLYFDGLDWLCLRGAERDVRGKWSAVAENTPLFAVCGDERGQLWMVGDNGLVLHFDGQEWHTQNTGSSAHLRAVTQLDNGHVLAAGADGTVLIGNSHTGSWQSLDCSFAGTIQSVLVDGDSVLLAGGSYDSRINRFAGHLWRISVESVNDLWDVTRRSDLLTAERTPRLRHLSQRTPGGPVFVVGDAGYSALLDESVVRMMGPVVQHDLLAGLFADDMGLVAVGDFGTLLINEFDSQETADNNADTDSWPQWRKVSVPTRRQLWAIATDGEGRLCCCGDGGVVLRRSGSGDAAIWQSMSAPTDNAQQCIVSDGHQGFYVGGQMGQIYHYDGKNWRLVFDLQLDITIIDFYSPSPDCIFAVGDEGLVLHWDGKTWQRMSSGTKSALYSIWGLDSEHVLAVGDFGLVLRWNGTEWREFHVGTDNFLFSVWGDALDNVFVVGLSGTIGHFDGTRWTLTPARAREDLLAMCNHRGELYAVGVNGVVLRKDGDQWVNEKCEASYALRAICSHETDGVFAVGDQGQVVVRDA